MILSGLSVKKVYREALAAYHMPTWPSDSNRTKSTGEEGQKQKGEHFENLEIKDLASVFTDTAAHLLSLS